MPLDKDSIDALEKVRQGTPARFVMLAKGVRILSLIVFRKGSVEGATRRAKEAGAGDLFIGTVDGQGANISFKLARADGYDKPPARDLIVKAFLADSKLDFRPVMEIVDQLPDVPLEDGGLPPPTNTSTPSRNPLPHAPPRPQPRPGVVYRTLNEWESILAKIGQTADAPTKDRLISQAIADLRQERTQIENDPLMFGDPNAKSEQNGVHLKVGTRLKTLSTLPLPPTTNMPPLQRQPEPPPPTPPRNIQTNEQTGVQSLTSKVDEERKMLIADMQRRATAFKPITPPYTVPQLRDILTECETDKTSDFGQIAALMVVAPGERYALTTQNLMDARTAAKKYIKDHADPKIGKLPSRVLKRREYCQKFLPQIESVLDQLDKREATAAGMIETYRALLEKNYPIPFGVTDEIKQVLAKFPLSAETQAELKRIINEIQTADSARGYQKLAQMNNPSELEKAELLLGHGCYKETGGGSSDVRLLRNPDRSVAFAFKGVHGESQGALGMLKLPEGACATREDLSSALCQEIVRQTGFDLGFPKSQAINVAGTTGALIEGIRGNSCDYEEQVMVKGDHSRWGSELEMLEPQLDRLESERQRLESKTPRDQEALDQVNKNLNGLKKDRDETIRKRDELKKNLDEVTKNLNELPDKITPQSLQKVVLFSTLACQWDCKWGNLLIEGEGNARPLDGGAAFPTQDMVDNFATHYKDKNQPLALLALTQYPMGNDKFGQNLPQAQQPMDPETVRAIMKIDVQALITATKKRRDALVHKYPELAPPPHTKGLVDDTTLNRVTSSIQATQDILRKNPKCTLTEFATAYQDWWIRWIQANAT